jgi:hypothetical protein
MRRAEMEERAGETTIKNDDATLSGREGMMTADSKEEMEE